MSINVDTKLIQYQANKSWGNVDFIFNTRIQLGHEAASQKTKEQLDAHMNLRRYCNE